MTFAMINMVPLKSANPSTVTTSNCAAARAAALTNSGIGEYRFGDDHPTQQAHHRKPCNGRHRDERIRQGVFVDLVAA